LRKKIKPFRDFMASRELKTKVEADFAEQALKLFRVKKIVKEDERTHFLLKVGAISALVDCL
jgi:hypothetical protein